MVPKGRGGTNRNSGRRKALLEKVGSECLNSPGTYQMKNESGRVIYVGQSGRLRTRLLSYFRAKGRRNKAAFILRNTHEIFWDYLPDQFGAQLNELRLIKQLRPELNQAMSSDEWQRAWIALSDGEIPGIRIVRRTDDVKSESLWGPFRRVTDLRDASRALAEITGLRDCSLENSYNKTSVPRLWFEDSERKPRSRNRRVAGCIRAELGSCMGPCIGQGNSEDWANSVKMTRDFLNTVSDKPIRSALAMRDEAVNALQFEKAAVIQTRIQRLEWLYKRLSLFRMSMDSFTFSYNPEHSNSVYIVRRGTVRAVVKVPESIQEKEELEQLRNRVFSNTEALDSDIPLHDLEEYHIVARWFRRNPNELSRVVRPI